MPEDILSLLPRKKVYGPIPTTIGILIGGPLVAAYFANRNFIIFERSFSRKGIWMISIFIVLVLVFIDLVYPIPSHFPLYYFFFNVLITAWTRAQMSKDKLKNYQDNGGKLNSIWKGLLLGFLSLILTFFVVVLGAFLYDLIFVFQTNDYPRITPLH
jgi:hypothetical protein